MSYDTDGSLKPAKWPENYPLTYEARGQRLLNDIYKVLEDIKHEMILLRGDVQHLYTAQTAGAPQSKPKARR